MQNPTRLSLDDLKRANQAKKNKRMETRDDPSTLLREDILFVLHQGEVSSLDYVLCEALSKWGNTLSNEHKRNILNVLKYIQED